MKSDPVDFAGLLIERFSHDLLNPLSALMNSAELLSTAKTGADRTVLAVLMEQCSRSLIDRLDFYRMAFNGDSAGLESCIAARDIILRWLDGGQVGFEWIVETDVVERAFIALIMNLVQLVSVMFLRAGQVRVEAQGRDITIMADGPRFAMDDTIRDILTGHARANTSRTAIAGLIRKLLIRHQAQLHIDETVHDRLVLRVTDMQA